MSSEWALADLSVVAKAIAENETTATEVTYVLIAIVKKELQLEASLYTLLQILSVSVFEKIQISCAFQPHEHSENQTNIANQLNLFEI